MNQLEKYVYEAIAVLPHYHKAEGKDDVDLGAATNQVPPYIRKHFKVDIDEEGIKLALMKSSLFSFTNGMEYILFAKPIYFKYRGLSNGFFFIDILLNKRLYTAKLNELNDPMEGRYLYNPEQYSDQNISDIKKRQNSLRICSLSKTLNNTLLWSHYADGHRGIALGIELKSKNEVCPLKYSSNCLSLDPYCTTTAINILAHKEKDWSYEKEVRVFSKRRKFIEIKIRIIVLGMKMKPEEKDTVKKLLAKIDKDIIVVEDFKGRFGGHAFYY
ncbi:DUF2971 domain-containing protein [uncultured Bacteroides sp.]|uniref:DUF2971 domain-containing protein n=1 Tax=uncultured Bacteroides sp. TaxID=162156 RepID=UPI002AA90411|nr:DUF2971 domain-containing protein [uncultured Bacteroides sp.]